MKLHLGKVCWQKKIIFDQNCEKLAFPQFFNKGRFGYSAEREIKLSPSKYFNQRLLNSFASNSDLLHNQFYKKGILEIRFQLLWKKKMGNFKAGIFKNYKHSVEGLVNKGQGFSWIKLGEHQPVGKGFSMKFLWW